MKIYIGFLLACAAVVALVGCGSSDSDEDRIIGRIQSLLAAANREDLQGTMRNYSLDYCDADDFCSGGTYQDERDCWDDVFNDPLSSVVFSDYRVLDVQINQTSTEGYIDAIVHFTVYDEFGNFVGEDDYSFRMFMINEGGEWLMWGDGGCFDSPQSGKHSWKDRLGKKTKAGGDTTRKMVTIPKR